MKQTTIHFTKPILLLLPLLILFAFSCANENQDAQEHDYTVTINTTVTRAAFPSVDTSLTYFFAQVVDASNPTTVLSTAKSTTTSISMSFSSYASLMTLTVYGYDSDTVLNTAAASTSPGDTALFCGTVNNLTSSTLAAGAVSVTLSPVKTTGTGTISLPIQFPVSPTYPSIPGSSFTIDSVKATLKNVATSTLYTKTFSSSDFPTSGTATITISSLADSLNTEVSKFPSGSYSLTLEFYKEGNSTTPVRTFFDFLNIWSNMKTTEWQSSSNGKLSSSALILKDEDFSYSYAKPASVTLEYYSSASTVTPTLYTNAARSTSSSFDPTTTTTDYYLSNTTEGGQNLSLTVKLAMQGQSFTVSNEVSSYDSTATKTIHNEPMSSFYSASSGFFGLVPLYAGTNTVTVTCTGRDGTTTETYTFSLLNPYYYVDSTTGKDLFSDNNKTLTSGGGSSSLPLSTIQQAVYSITAENNARRTQNSSDTTNYTIYLNGTISTVNKTDTSLSSYYSMVSIVSTDKPLNITIAGKNGNNTLDGIDVSKYNKNAPTQVRGLFVYENATSASSAVLLTLKDIYITGGSIATSIEAANSPSGSAILARGGGALLCNTNVLLKNVIIGSTSTVSDAATETSCANYASEDGGGIAVVNGVASFDSSCIIRSNYSPATTNGYGGGGLSIFGGSKVTLDGTTVSYNSSKHGGGIYIYNGALSCSGSTKIQSNNATYGGGGLYIVLSGASATLSGTSEISSNTLALSVGTEFYGAGVYLKSGTLTMNGSSKISQNVLPSVTKSFGGGIYITDSDSLANSGTVTITSGTVSSNTGATAGGGIYIAGGTLSLSNAAVISDNALSSGNVNGPQVYIAGDKTDTSSVLISQPTCILTGGASIANSGTGYTHSVYLSTGKQIKLSGSVSAMASAIVLLPQSYPSATSAVQVLSADTAYTLTDTDVAKFSVVPEVVDASTSTTRTWLIADSTKSPLTPGTLYYDGTSTISIVNGIETMVFNNSSVSVKTGNLITLKAPTIGGTTYPFDANTVCYIDGVQLTGTANNDAANTKYNGMMIAYATNNETATLTPPTKAGVYTVSLIVTKDGTDYSLTFTLTVTQ